MAEQLLTAVVGSYPQPDWLVDRELLRQLMAPRIRVEQIWRVPEPLLEQARDDATVVAICDQERAGIDIITDGEIRRESYSNRFANALSGIDKERHGEIIGRTGVRIPVPLVSGPIERTGPVEVRDLEFLRAHTDRRIKITLPGPFTMAQQAVDEYYGDEESLALAYADAVNEEVHALFAAGADVVQLDEPWLQSRAEQARRYGVKAINRALADSPGTTAVHLCFGYAALVKDKTATGYAFLAELEDSAADQISIEAAQPGLDLAILKSLPSKTVMVGVLDLNDPEVEAPETVAARIRRALDIVPAGRLIVTPDCGMKYLPRDTAFGKLRSLAEGTGIVRGEIQ
ncbi:5-methyltetrahydropteroyltriglutamate--homocysteine methyltransferase [Candidatus Rariloculus sp.]|uniref:5-methyltetrahydropteroyltriglutamate-- homocysteine methyltransferase n=1 Tax=Candidatus Rariloculus sp. TaxID=3101265 RepID=UPI003D0C8624